MSADPLVTEAEAATRTWLEDVVLRLDLCPFAHDPFARGVVRVVARPAPDLETVLTEVVLEAVALVQGPHETTLLALPGAALADFEDLLDALDAAEDTLDRTGHGDAVQLVGFHPDYRFADAEPDDPANGTNRSPTPMLHLLRRADVARAIAGHPDIESIPARNVALLRELARRA